MKTAKSKNKKILELCRRININNLAENKMLERGLSQEIDLVYGSGTDLRNVSAVLFFQTKINPENGNYILLLKRLIDGRFKSLKDFTLVMNQKIDVVYKDCRYGGKRYYMKCGVCDKRFEILYFPYGDNPYNIFKCRKCGELIYNSSAEQNKSKINIKQTVKDILSGRLQ
ncbi:hypothetical protein KA977_14995 [Candidatus Dependentiae bacterium]|nr:hypothetical protein [Candidatus Dependentiae bacterium]